MSLNKVMLIGNLGRDPEVRTLTSGDKMVSFSLATTDSWRDKNTGERKDRTEWHNIVVFNEGLARVIEQYCKKGSKIYIEGRLQTREYEDRDGNKRKATEIVLPKFNGAVELLDTRKSERGPASPDDYGRTTTRESGGGESQPSGSRTMDLDDDIPF